MSSQVTKRIASHGFLDRLSNHRNVIYGLPRVNDQMDGHENEGPDIGFEADASDVDRPRQPLADSLRSHETITAVTRESQLVRVARIIEVLTVAILRACHVPSLTAQMRLSSGPSRDKVACLETKLGHRCAMPQPPVAPFSSPLLIHSPPVTNAPGGASGSALILSLWSLIARDNALAVQAVRASLREWKSL